MGMDKMSDKGITYDFGGKTAIVTGGASGIGRVIAKAFARQGASVIVGDINLAGAQETVRAIEAAGGTALCYEVDVSKEDEVMNLVAFGADYFGKIDFACNDAGVGTDFVPITDTPKEAWDRIVAINMTGVFLCLKYELRQMLRQGFGSIVNMASAASFIGSPGMVGYAAAKHGVAGLTKTAAVEVADKGIRVNAVAPGIVNAGLTDSSPREFIDRAIASHPIGRMAEADEIAAAVLWLCSDGASFVLGHILPVEGGFTAR
jgi:NAD(P)-dependent dehydrogenase (short-subunit alcohol dehydrogenase family)